MLSVIIPTMQVNLKIFNMLLKQLIDNDIIGEIIIIDNSRKGIDIVSDKLKVIIPDKNLYVNSSWNLGVKLAKYDYVCILNDDLIFPKTFFHQVFIYLKHDISIDFIGLGIIPRMSPENINEYPEDAELQFQKIEQRISSCWGSAIFFYKNKYVEIPEQLKVWCGDDFLFYSAKNNYQILNSNVKHAHMLTSNLPEFYDIKYNDVKIYKKMNPNYTFR